jgi:fatty-acid desaturase
LEALPVRRKRKLGLLLMLEAEITNPPRPPRPAGEIAAALKSKRSALPSGVDRKVRWDYMVPICLMHLLGLLVLVPWLFRWSGLVAFLVGTVMFGQLGVPIGYHRLLTHRSFRVPKWLEYGFVLMALCSAQETPAKWVSWHRRHHQFADDQEDPHSPLVTFFWSHIGWLFYDNRATHSAAAYHRYARDLLDDPFYMFLEKRRPAASLIYLAHAAVFFAAGLAVGWASTGNWLAGVQFGLSLLVWGVIARTIYVWHITWAVNSLGHMFGYRNYETNEESRNNWFVALITGGEGWHNNHHQDPTSACLHHRWWEFDPNYYIIKSLELVGLASHLVPPRRTPREVEK